MCLPPETDRVLFLCAFLFFVVFSSLIGQGDGDVLGVQMIMVGVSGTVFRVVPGVLNPGDTVRVPIWVRGLGGGKQTLRYVYSTLLVVFCVGWFAHRTAYYLNIQDTGPI